MRRLGTVRAVPESASAAHSAAVDHASLRRAVATSAASCSSPQRGSVRRAAVVQNGVCFFFVFVTSFIGEYP